MQNTIIRTFENDPNVVAAAFNDGESLATNQTFWTNYFLRDFLLMDPMQQATGNYKQPSTGLPFGRGFIVAPDGTVALPYFGHQPDMAIRSLQAFQGGGLSVTPSSSTLSRSSGTPLALTVDGSPIRDGVPYVTALTLSGTTPGTILEGVQVPINMDGLTWAGLLLAGTPLFPDFMGTLDARGRAWPALAPTASQIPAAMVGYKLWFAVVTFEPRGLSTSPAAEVTITP